MKRRMMFEKFVTKLQTPPGSSDTPYDKAMLLKGVEKAKELEQAIYDLPPSIKDAEKIR